mmetsp:Transcript_23357/g.50577  ORF Transcript_23357/g.50577 Transcript_23357/m.50577 type:complete len:94 (-) Transcript_23357:77-358(-)
MRITHFGLQVTCNMPSPVLDDALIVITTGCAVATQLVGYSCHRYDVSISNMSYQQENDASTKAHRHQSQYAWKPKAIWATELSILCISNSPCL